jgi:hypothetical protein
MSEQERLKHMTEELIRHFDDPENVERFRAEFDQLSEDDKWRIDRAARQLVALFSRADAE